MLRKRSRPLEKEHKLMADLTSESHLVRSSSSSSSLFCGVPGLFLGLTTKGFDIVDSARSPTSVLDYKQYLFARPPPRSPAAAGGGLDATTHPKSWYCSSMLGLGLLDSLLNDDHHVSNPCVFFGSSQMRRINIPTPNTRFKNGGGLAAPRSLPANCGIPNKTKDTDFLQPMPNAELNNASLPITIASLSAREIELSEDYTRVISHGPNPKTTHIFGDFILDSLPFQSSLNNKGENLLLFCPSDDCLSYCFFCKKKLEQGKDPGEKIFCSCDCGNQEVLFDEEIEKPTSESFSDSLGRSFHEEFFLPGMTADVKASSGPEFADYC